MKRTIMVAALIVACVGFVSLAQAKPKPDFKTNATLRAQDNGDVIVFSGAVRSRVKRCEVGRRVFLFLDGTGRRAADTSDQNGRFSFRLDSAYVENGRYFVIANRKELRGRRDCAEGSSRAVRAGGR